MRRLSPEPGCQNNMLWRYELSETIPIEAFVTALAERGCRPRLQPAPPTLFPLVPHVAKVKLKLLSSRCQAKDAKLKLPS